VNLSIEEFEEESFVKVEEEMSEIKDAFGMA
jgi:hypothetical protein